MITTTLSPSLIAYALSLLSPDKRYLDLPPLSSPCTLQLTQNGTPIQGHSPSRPLTRIQLHFLGTSHEAYELQINDHFIDSATHYRYRIEAHLPHDHPLFQLIPPSPLSHLFPTATLYQPLSLSLPETHRLLHYAIPQDLHPLLSQHLLSWEHPLRITHHFSAWPQPGSPLFADTTLHYTPKNLPADLQRSPYEHQEHHPLLLPSWRPHIPDITNHLLLSALLPLIPSPWIPVYLSNHPHPENPHTLSPGYLYPTPLDPSYSHFLSSDRYMLLFNPDNSLPPFDTLQFLNSHAKNENNSPFVPLANLLPASSPHESPPCYQNVLQAFHSILHTLDQHAHHLCLQHLSC